jgi:hypothetical protein
MSGVEIIRDSLKRLSNIFTTLPPVGFGFGAENDKYEKADSICVPSIICSDIVLMILWYSYKSLNQFFFIVIFKKGSTRLEIILVNIIIIFLSYIKDSKTIYYIVI